MYLRRVTAHTGPVMRKPGHKPGRKGVKQNMLSIEKHIEEMMSKAWKFIEDAGITEDEAAYKENPNLVLVYDIHEVRDAYCEDLENGVNIENEDLYEFLDRHGIDWK